MKYKVYTNESFEKYIDYISLGKKYEDRWDTLDFDDVVADIDIPSEGEVDSAVRKLDLVDDIVDKHGSGVEVGSDGNIREIDLDDKKDSSQSPKETKDKVRKIDLDDKPNSKAKPSDTVSTIGDLDYDDKGKDVKQAKSNVGALGALDYDKDVDVSSIAASIEDVYTGLTSNDVKRVKSLVKRYAVDLTNEDKLKEIMLAHAIKLNFECLRVMCGDMQIKLTAKEKRLDYINREDIQDALNRFKKIASKLDGKNNTYGLIPNAIVQCTPEKESDCSNIIDFLMVWCNLPVFPVYLRGAITRKLYNVSELILSKLNESDITVELLTGKKGLLTKISSFTDIPPELINGIALKAINKSTPTSVVGRIFISCAKNGIPEAAKNVNTIFGKGSNRVKMISNYIEDVDEDAFKLLKKYFK